MLRWMLAAAALALIAAPCPTAARPLTVDDLLHAESLGAAAIDPGGRWLVFERRGPYDSGVRYDYDHANSLAVSRLQIVDLKQPALARPLLRPDAGPGVVMGPFSPSGRRLAVYRFQDRSWTLGLVTVATGEVQWLDVTPDSDRGGRALQWLSDDALLVIARGDRRPPMELRRGWDLADRLPKLWEASATGAGAHTVLGSGVYADVRRRAPPNQLLRIDAATGKAEALATGAFFDLELSPDRRRVALFRSGPDLQVSQDRPVRGPAGVETEATRLTLLDLGSGAQVSPCPGCDLLPQLLSWSPSGKALLVLARGPDGLWTHGQLRRVEVATGASEPVGVGLELRADLNPVTVWTGWMGDDPLVFARRQMDSDGRDDWYRVTARGPINLTAALPPPDKRLRLTSGDRLTVLSGAGLWSVDRHGGSARRRVAQAALATVAADDARSRLGPAQHGTAWLLAGDAPRRSLAALDASERRGPSEIPDGPGELVAASTSAAAAVRHETEPAGVERLWLQASGRPRVLLATLNDGLADTDVPRVLAVRHKGPAGQALTSWLFLPTTAAERPPPLLVRPYLGGVYPRPPQAPPAEAGFLLNIRVLTGHGYAVLVPSLPNPPGGMTDPADHLADRILEIVDIAARDPQLGATFDASRLGVAGFSFGGYTVMTALTQTHRFRAGVAISGISDLVAYWASLSPFAFVDPEDGYASNWHTGGVEATQPTLLAPPWADPDRYARNSPLLAADRIETPLLLIHGAQDPIPFAGSEAMYSALFRRGKDAMLVTYWGALHGVTSPGDLRDLYARTFSFLDEHFAKGATILSARPEGSRGPASANSAPRLPPPPRPQDRSPRR